VKKLADSYASLVGTEEALQRRRILADAGSLCPEYHCSRNHRPQYFRFTHLLRSNRQDVAVQQNQVCALAGGNSSDGIEIHGSR